MVSYTWLTSLQLAPRQVLESSCYGEELDRIDWHILAQSCKLFVDRNEFKSHILDYKSILSVIYRFADSVTTIALIQLDAYNTIGLLYDRGF
jgi:hypothetical protein